MIWDRAREPAWANALLGQVKRVHPVFVAIFLVATALLITRISESEASGMRAHRAAQ